MRVTNGERKTAKERETKEKERGDRTAVKKAQRREEGEAEQESGDQEKGKGAEGAAGAGRRGRREEDGGHHGVSQTGPPVLWESCLSPMGALPSRRGQALHWLIRNTQR